MTFLGMKLRRQNVVMSNRGCKLIPVVGRRQHVRAIPQLDNIRMQKIEVRAIKSVEKLVVSFCADCVPTHMG